MTNISLTISRIWIRTSSVIKVRFLEETVLYLKYYILEPPLSSSIFLTGTTDFSRSETVAGRSTDSITQCHVIRVEFELNPYYANNLYATVTRLGVTSFSVEADL